MEEFWFLIEQLQEWREKDHEDNKKLTRHEIITILEGIRKLELEH